MLAADSAFVRRAARRSPIVRLVCMPYAGAGASIYAEWPDLLSPEIEVIAIQPPGREDRQLEPPFASVWPLVRALGKAVRPYLERPTAFFGHCTGALLAFELAREVETRFGVSPGHLIASGQPAPHLPQKFPAIHTLPDEEFRDHLRRLEGTAPEILQDDDLMELLLPCLRADFAMWGSYRFAGGDPLPCPITAFGGTRDAEAGVEELMGWERHTAGGFTLRLFDGGHFFFSELRRELTRAIVEELL
jgi:medium-chain acyl-[acyl-carrier-protein] hydrolase